MTETDAQPIAAVDLGSNSFHMIVAATRDGQFKVIDRMREMVRLAAGLDSSDLIVPEAMDRAIACLQRFGERVRSLPPGNVRVVGTNALRKARNSPAFLLRAEEALGHPIDVVSGTEEARLIYLGVSHGLEDDADIRLVIDIGGGSTELILGRHFDPMQMESLHMGCVSMSERYFGDGVLDGKRMRAAEIAARQELKPIEAPYRRIGWQSAIGASGTMLAIRDVALGEGWSREGITPESLARIKQELIRAGSIEAVHFAGLSNERRAVFPGGVAILAACFEQLRIGMMAVSDLALREGLLYDLLGRIHHEDVRERTVIDLVEQYRIDRDQANRVDTLAQSLLTQVAADWQLANEESQRLLRWSATLHEIGQAIAHTQYHKHGAYLLTNLDMPGFSRDEQRRLAAIVRSHRRRINTIDFDTLAPTQVTRCLRLCLILRLAVVLHRGREAQPGPEIGFEVEGSTLKLRFPPDWLDQHPLTRADLEHEADYQKTAGFKLKCK